MITYFDTISNENVLRGLLHKGNNNIPIIIVHGFFSSNKIGPYRLYFELADRLNKKGFSVLRIDLSGMGESDGNISQVTFDTHILDLYNGINALLKAVDSNKVHIIAHCLGCCTSLKCLKMLDPLIESLTFIAPFFPTTTSLKTLLGEDGYEQLSHKTPIYHKGMYCDTSFISASNTINDIELLELANINSFKVFLPEKDQFSFLNNGIEWACMHSITYEVIKNADHNFLTSDARKKLFFHILNNFENGKQHS